MCPLSIMKDGQRVEGIIAAASTPETTRIQQVNLEERPRTGRITDPFWFAMQVWWFPKLAFLNFAGMTDPTYNGHMLPVKFGVFMEEQCRERGFRMPDTTVYDGAVLGPLRALLVQLATPVWAEVTIGSSYLEYRALDAYLRIYGARIASPEVEAHYVLNTEQAPLYRRLYTPEDWYACRCRYSVRQKPVIHGTSPE